MEEKRKVKRYILQSKKVHEKFGVKMNQDQNENKKLSWQDGCKVKGRKVENCRKIKDREGLKFEGFGRSILRIFIT